MRQVWNTKVGDPETLEVREAPDPSPAIGEVRIRVKASGINFADIMARVGVYPDAPKFPAVMGYEVSGLVDSVGPGVTTLKKDDRVIALCRFGGFSDVLCVPQSQVFSLPDGLTFSQGAALPVNYLTAYQMLFVMGSLKAGEHVLVHSAAGGVGFAAGDLCRIAGAIVIGTASASKHAILKERGVAHTIDYRTQDFEKEILRVTDGKGVHLILDPIGGDSWAKGLRSLRATGRLVVFGFSAAATGKRRNVLSTLKTLFNIPWLKFNPLYLMSENKAVIGVNVGHLWSEGAAIRSWMEQILSWCREGKIRPTVDREFTFAEAALAHHYIQDRKNIGKVVLVP